MSKRAEKRALELFPIDMQMCIDNKGKPYEADVNEHRRKYVALGYEQAEKDLIPLINRLCEAILFDWDNKVELAWEIQSKIKEETK